MSKDSECSLNDKIVEKYVDTLIGVAIKSRIEVFSFESYTQTFVLCDPNEERELIANEVFVYRNDDEHDTRKHEWYEYCCGEGEIEMSLVDYEARVRDRYFYCGVTIDKDGRRRYLIYGKAEDQLYVVSEEYFKGSVKVREGFARSRFLIDQPSETVGTTVWVGESI